MTTDVGSSVGAATEGAPKKKPRKLIFLALALLALVVLAISAVVGGVAANAKPDAQTVAKSYLKAVSDGNGDQALQYLDSHSKGAFDLAASKELAAAKSRIQNIKVGDDLGIKPEQSEQAALVRTSYDLNGRTVTKDLQLAKTGDAWLIQNPDQLNLSLNPPVWNGPRATMAEAPNFDFTIKLGAGTTLEPSKTARFFPAEYAVNYSGSKYLKAATTSVSSQTESLVTFDSAAVQSALQDQMTKYVNDCLADGQTSPEVGGQPCGFASVVMPATLAKGIQTDTSDWKLTSGPVLQIDKPVQGGWGMSFSATVHRVWINTLDSTVGANENVKPEISCSGNYGFSAQGEPVFTTGSCSLPGRYLSFGSMYALVNHTDS